MHGRRCDNCRKGLLNTLSRKPMAFAIRRFSLKCDIAYGVLEVCQISHNCDICANRAQVLKDVSSSKGHSSTPLNKMSGRE